MKNLHYGKNDMGLHGTHLQEGTHGPTEPHDLSLGCNLLRCLLLADATATSPYTSSIYAHVRPLTTYVRQAQKVEINARGAPSASLWQ